MNMCADKVEVAVEELKDSAPSADGSGVVLETDALVNGQRTETSIEVQTVDAPAMAAALLNVETPAAQVGDDLPPAVRCLGAGVVHWTHPDSVRLHLQFDSGQVLPVEMSKDAALALCHGLFEHARGLPGASKPAS